MFLYYFSRCEQLTYNKVFHNTILLWKNILIKNYLVPFKKVKIPLKKKKRPCKKVAEIKK